ncbi:glutamine amidotransferase [Marinobacter gelidimuriae]|uniref:glutamine amidotransferase n=1 Tax=Marinobacter gelidimuriae TaxID=2739064 RepID=UPI00036096A5|nr:glutamine amidotransferase [Marinobacter gelidimuriae]
MTTPLADTRKPRVIIVKTGETYPQIRERCGDFESWFVRGLSSALELSVVNVVAGESPGEPSDWDGIVITGSPAMVSNRDPWSEQTAQWLAAAVTAKVPLLGVCYGHQLLAHALGGTVDYHPEGRESGTHTVTLTESAASDALFGTMPSQFSAQLTHKQSVLSLPPQAVLLGTSDFEPHQAFRIGECAWGVQFHPEFTDEVMRVYLAVQALDIESEGSDAAALLAAVKPAPEASSLLQRFSELVLSGRY